MIGVSPKDNFDDLKTAIRTALLQLNIGLDQEALIHYFTYLQLDNTEQADRRSLLKSIGVPLNGSEAYTDPHRWTCDWRFEPALGWINNASHSYRNPKAEGQEWLECGGFEIFTNFIEMNRVRD